MTLASIADPPRWAVNGAYTLARPGVEWLARRLFDVSVSGRDRIPARGPCIMASNHLSFIDPVMTSMATRRNVRFLAVGFLFNRSPVFDKLILYFGAIPTHRDVVPVGAVRAALRDLEAGDVIGLYPEGRRVETWGEEAPARGAAWLSIATGAPLFPVPMHGTANLLSIKEKRFRRTPIRVWIEEPLDPMDYTGAADPTAAMMRDWRSAMDERLGPWWRKGESRGGSA